MKRTFTYKSDKSDKFWAIEVQNNEFTVTYGKTGTSGQTQTKTFADAAACQKEADKKVAEKLKEGYQEQSANPQSEAPKPPEKTEVKLDGTWYNEVKKGGFDNDLIYTIEGSNFILVFKKRKSNDIVFAEKGTISLSGNKITFHIKETSEDLNKWKNYSDNNKYKFELTEEIFVLIDGKSRNKFFRNKPVEAPKKSEKTYVYSEPNLTKTKDVKKLLDELNNRLNEKGCEQIEFTKPISSKEIDEAEKKLGVKLPSSYIDFVTTFGVFSISGELTGKGLGNDTCMLPPKKIVKKTLEYREEFSEYDDDSEERKIADDGLFFCADPTDEFYYVFVISSADELGEMNARRFDYDDFGMNDPWFEGDMSFYSCIEDIVDLIQENNKE